MSRQHFSYNEHFWELPLGKEIGFGSQNWADSAHFWKIQIVLGDGLQKKKIKDQ